jgi:hypothetical protein
MILNNFPQTIFSLVLLLSYFVNLSATDWSQLEANGKNLGTAEFWDPAHISNAAGTSKAQDAFVDNVTSADHIMRILPTGQDYTQLIWHKVYSYNDSDFDVYRQKVPDYANEQLQLGRWLNSLVRENLSNQHFTSSVDRFFRRLHSLAKNESWVKQLQQELLATRLGIGPDVFDQHPDFEAFVKNNFLFKHLPYHKHKASVDASGMPLLLVENTLTPWDTIKGLVDTDADGRMENYFYTHEGLVPGKPDDVLRVFKKISPNTYHEQYILEIMSIKTMPPHNWIRLVNPQGDVYSIGFWGITPMNDIWSAIQHVIPESGRVTSPDLMEIAGDPKNMIATPIKLTEEQYQDVLNYIEEYQKNPRNYQILGWLGGDNCAVFVHNIMNYLGFKIKASSWVRPFDNPYDVLDWQRYVSRWRLNELDTLKDPSPEERMNVEYSLPSQ